MVGSAHPTIKLLYIKQQLTQTLGLQMKIFHIILFILGLILTAYGIMLWSSSGFSFNIKDISSMFFGTRPWHLEKDSYLVFLVLGLSVIAYSSFELHLKRWEKE